MTKGRHARTVFVSAKLKAELQAYAAQATCVDRIQGIAIHLLKTLAGHRSISITAAYLYSSPNLLKAAVELA